MTTKDYHRPTTRQFYLQLHFDTLWSPEIRLFGAMWRCALIDILAYAVRSDEPGVITISPAQLAKLVGFRKLEKFEEFLRILEERRIIGFRKEDDAIVVNPNLIPQVPATAGGECFPRRRRPSEQPEALRERKTRSRHTQKALDLVECHDLNRDISATTTETKKIVDQEQQTTHPPAAPVVASDQDQVNSAVAVVPDPTASKSDDRSTTAINTETRANTGAFPQLMMHGITKRSAAQLVQQHGAAECLRQLDYLPFRSARDPAATLVRSIDEAWSRPPNYKPPKKPTQAAPPDPTSGAAAAFARARKATGGLGA